MKADEQYMRRAFELARKGAGFVSPNPLAGCVIVKNEKIFAEGYHKKFGGPHAEVVALKKASAKGATLYVNLEPCVAHAGKKTPPCTDAIIRAGVNRVVVGTKDPNPAVAGRGIKKLRQAGIEVTVGVLEKDCKELNEIFIKWIQTKKAFVLLKVALTLDGALTFKKGARSDFSSPESYVHVHELRQQYDAIGLGIESVLIDNPLLTTRRKNKISRNPVRVIFDTNGRMPKDARMLKEAGQTIIFTANKKLKIPNATTVVLPKEKNGYISLRRTLDWLGGQGIASIMVEGGASVARSILFEGLADKVMLTFTPHFSGDPQAPRLFPGLRKFAYRFDHWERRGVDTWYVGYR